MTESVRMLSTVQGLRASGFEGFIRIADLDPGQIPPEPGIYAVVWDAPEPPLVADTSVGGWFKKKNPTVPRLSAESRLIPDVQLLYLGKAGVGANGKRGLRARIAEYLSFGRGEPIGHWGGRLIWQLQDPGRLLIGWKIILDDNPERVEKSLLRAFKEEFGQLPYANLRL